MQPIIPLWLIYLSGICDDLRSFFIWGGIIGLGALAFVSFGYLECEGGLIPHFKKCLAISILSIFLSVIIPSQKTMYTIMVSSQITPKNIELIGGTVKSTVDYMFNKTDQLIKTIKEGNK